ncbi:Transcription factor [Penicillium chermesinum]|uniref:Transcription factor n=1 Tax=Penicillium chermesinum TaxID=63820 RepID=A0A9W9PHD6_9EURO|nr:Transcription factor [Penicillium chermesinum]KAJ5246212.1 Transcription factor [Penicillium chermesinum]
MSAEGGNAKRRCVSTACIACRRRKSKVAYLSPCLLNILLIVSSATEIFLAVRLAHPYIILLVCIYDPNSDNRRKGVYKKDADAMRTKHTTLHTLIQALLNYEEEDAFDLVRQLRSCDDLEEVARSIVSQEKGFSSGATKGDLAGDDNPSKFDQFESELSGRMSELVLDGSRKFIGGTSNLIFLPADSEFHDAPGAGDTHPNAVKSWTQVTEDDSLISHLLTMYFTWHYPFFTILSKDLFYRDYMRRTSTSYCSALLVNAMLALGCHFSSWTGAYADPQDIATAGNHFFKEAKRLIHENDEHENAKLCTVQAFALMSVREAGCGREGKGWVYSGLSFRMALDLGLNIDTRNTGRQGLSEDELDARRITFWGCYLIDKCWSNYLGRQPQLSASHVPKFDVFPKEETEIWSPYTDSGPSPDHAQPSRTRAVAIQISKLCEISNDLMKFFYSPSESERAQSKQSELKRLSDVHTRLEAWKKELPHEFEPREGQLPQVLILLIHLYRPFLRYTKANTPLPSHVSPRKICTQAASSISKLMRIYKRTYGLKQICNIVVYMAHTACTIHLLNLPGRNPERDVVHGLRNLEEMADAWLAARRTLRILDISANKWQVPLPAEATIIFERTHTKWGSWGSWDQAVSPPASDDLSSPRPNISSVTTPSNSSVQHQNSAGNPPRGPFSCNAYGSTLERPHATCLTSPAQHIAAGQPPQHPAYGAPDTSYLSPMPPLQAKYDMAPAMTASGPTPSTQPGWFHPPANQVMPQTTMSPSSHGSPMSGFDGTDHLVEESQDWWNHNAAAGLEMGMNSWGGAGWISMPGMSAQSTVQFGGSPTPLMSMAPQPGPSMAQHRPRGVPNVPNTRNETPGYENHWE